MKRNCMQLLILVWFAVLAGTSCSDMIPEQAMQSWKNEMSLLLLPTGGNSPNGQIASVTTTAIAGNLTLTVDIAGTSAKGGGNVSDQGDSAVTERGLCWNTAGSPTISDAHAADGSGTGEFTDVSMTGLSENTAYHVRAYATNSQGTAYGNEITFNSGWAFHDTVRFGGYVFYNDGNGGGLVCAQSDQSVFQAWSNVDQTLLGTTNRSIGSGLANTNAIVGQSGHTYSAAQVCLDYDDGTHSDWFLPSFDEIGLMYSHLKVNGIGGFADKSYWCSSEYNYTSALAKSFVTIYYGQELKSNNWWVRAVRAF